MKPMESPISTSEKYVVSSRALCSLVLALMIASANADLLARADSQDLTVTASFADKEQIGPLDPIQLLLSRPVQPPEGKLAVFIDETDLTALFTATETDLSYSPKGFPLPAGGTRMIVYLVTPENDWKEIAQFPLRVLNAETAQPATGPAQDAGGSKNGGSNKALLTPALTIGLKSQVAQHHFPDANQPERSTYADFTLQGSIRTEIVRGGFGFQNQFDIVGSSYQKEALRFGQEGADAPRIDMSSHLMQFQAGKARVMAGHVAFGTNRYLINSFSSRGISLALPITSRADFSIAAVNGTSIVGWDNFFGLNRRKHQIVTGALGFEFIPERKGGLRLETSLLEGSLLPITNFNQGNLTDAERSKGIGFRVIATDPAGRLRIDGGLARSRFNNPQDPLLESGFETVPVRETTRNARYLDASYDILKGFKLTETKQANLTFTYRHEEIDPLFRSIAAFTQPDRLQNQFEAVASIADITTTVVHARSNDNLDEIPSILKTFGRRSGVIVGVPLVSLFGDPSNPSPWYPRLSYAFDRMHQFGAGLPVNSGFTSDSQVPDQISTNQSFLSEWQAQKWRFGYRFNRSFQDNRQLGREQADLRNLLNGFTVGLNPASSVDLNVEFSAESALNKEMLRTDRTYRLGPNVNWRMSKQSTLSATVSGILAGDLAQTSKSRNAEVDLQWSYRFGVERGGYRKVQGQFFIRYANRYARAFDSLFGFQNLTKLQTLNTGLSFTFF